MGVYVGEEAKIYYVVEENYGETPATPTMYGMTTAHPVEPALNPGLIKVRGIGSRDVQALKKGLRKVDVKIAYAIPSDAPIDFLQHITSLNSLSAEVFYEKTSGIIDLLHKGCIFNRLAVQCSIEDVIKAAVDLIGQDVVVGTAKIGNTYNDHSGAVSYNESYIKKDTTTLDRITDYRFLIENNLKRVPVIRTTSGHLLKYLKELHRNCSGDLTFEFESKEEFDDVINDSAFSLEFGLGGTSKAVFSGCKWENVSTPTRIEDLVSLKAPFVAKSVTIG